MESWFCIWYDLLHIFAVVRVANSMSQIYKIIPYMDSAELHSVRATRITGSSNHTIVLDYTAEISPTLLPQL